MPGPENTEEMYDIFTVTKEGFKKIVSKDISPHRNLEEQAAAYFAGFTIKCMIKKHLTIMGSSLATCSHCSEILMEQNEDIHLFTVMKEFKNDQRTSLINLLYF